MMRWVGQIAFIGEMRNACSINFKRTDHLVDLTVDGRVKSKWIFKKQSYRVWTGFNWIGIGPNECFWEHGNVHSGSIKM
jgi:hypothetical protein